MSSLQGKVALVTGSSRGIGATIATSLAKEGANVVVNYVSASSKAAAEDVAKAVRSHGSRALVVQANMASLEDLDSLVQKTVEHFGKIDILVNNAGIIELQPIGGITRESYTKQFDINVRAVIFLSQAAVPHMGDGGRIINLSSVAARLGSPASTVYAASKAAVESITRVMGVELRDKGIRVNSVNPGPVGTDMFNGLPDVVQTAFKAVAPVTDAIDIADVVTFLAGPQSRWVTGSTISTNNGVILN